MPKKNYDSDEYEEYVSYDDECSDSDVSSHHDDDESEYMYSLNHDPIIYDDIQRRPTEYKNLKLGETIIQVSNFGRIRMESTIFMSSEGIVHSGTPFRTYTVEWSENDYRTFFVHDLVWLAFHGHPPEGWEVRHKHAYTIHKKKAYSNALHNLTIVPITVTPLYNVKTT